MALVFDLAIGASFTGRLAAVTLARRTILSFLGHRWRGWRGFIDHRRTFARAFLQLVQAFGVIDDGVLRFLVEPEAALPLPLLLFTRGLDGLSGDGSTLVPPVGADGGASCMDWSDEVSVASRSTLGESDSGGIFMNRS